MASPNTWTDTVGTVEGLLPEMVRNTQISEHIIQKCRDLSPSVLVTACQKIYEEGYECFQDLLTDHTTRTSWCAFARHVRVPEAVIKKIAPQFGPDLPDMTGMGLQDRLHTELCAWYGGDFDTSWAVDPKTQVPKIFLVHDTDEETGLTICKEGRLKAGHANDSAYDGLLAYGEAPDVVFFQASNCGENESIYPRGYSGTKKRFLVPPAQLALHSEQYYMYFVKISESRQARAGDSSGLLQLHVLFLPSTHVKRKFCDEHFLIVNKHTFQPFHYNKRRQQWEGFSNDGRRSFGGRGVMVNVCIAQDVSVNPPNPLSPLFKYPADLAKVAGGITEAPGQRQKGARAGSTPRRACRHWMMEGRCQKESCDFHHVGWVAYDSKQHSFSTVNVGSPDLAQKGTWGQAALTQPPVEAGEAAEQHNKTNSHSEKYRLLGEAIRDAVAPTEGRGIKLSLLKKTLGRKGEVLLEQLMAEFPWKKMWQILRDVPTGYFELQKGMPGHETVMPCSDELRGEGDDAEGYVSDPHMKKFAISTVGEGRGIMGRSSRSEWCHDPCAEVVVDSVREEQQVNLQGQLMLKPQSKGGSTPADSHVQHASLTDCAIMPLAEEGTDA